MIKNTIKYGMDSRDQLNEMNCEQAEDNVRLAK